MYLFKFNIVYSALDLLYNIEGAIDISPLICDI